MARAGAVYRDRGWREDAMAQLSDAAAGAKAPAERAAYLEQAGRLAFERGDREEALRFFQEALRTDPDQRSRSQYMRTFARPGYDEELLADDAALLRQFFTDAVDVEQVVAAAREPGALAAWLTWYPGQRLEDLGDTPAVTVPTLHVWSDGDAALGPEATHATREWVTGPYRLEVLEGVSHWIPEEAAGRVAPLLLEHLATVEA
jgi:pimeloyl-ACP methyl ester carboxylesterase